MESGRAAADMKMTMLAQDTFESDGGDAIPTRHAIRPRRVTPWTVVAVAILCVGSVVPRSSRASSPTPGNAADDYRRAFDEIGRLPEADGTLPAAGERLPPAGTSQAIVARLSPAMKCLHEATARQQCDWGTDLPRRGAAATFPHVPRSQDLARRALFRARWQWHMRDRDQALADARAVVVLARRVGDEGNSGLLGLTERYKIEQTVVDVLRQWMTDAESARLMDDLFRLALQPDENLPKAGLLQFRQYIGKLDGAGNPFSQVAIVRCPGIPAAYLQSRKLRAQWTILRAASEVLRRGPDAAKEIDDPYGNGPLKYQATSEGFTLRSTLVIDGKDVALEFAKTPREPPEK